jgi:phenylpropionate dioxygenase-like ring-hydroxylating dioxygenase large terminal subunit
VKFLYNRWYAAAWPNEIPRNKPFKRKILGEVITFYRKSDGSPVGVSSVCPHRFAPMHYGEVAGDNIRCVYHGLEFGPDGACVLNPDGSPAPKTGLKSYRVEEKDSMVWIWMGDQEPQSGPPEWLAFEPRFGGFTRGYTHFGCNYQLLNDNLLDHSHATHLHPFLRTEALVKNPKHEVIDEGERIWCKGWAPGKPANPYFGALLNYNGAVDQWVEARWDAPATITVFAGATPTGRPREEGVLTQAVHLITPESDSSSHLFFGLVRDRKLDDHEFSEMTRATVDALIKNEDKWMVEGQQEIIEGQDFWALRPVLLPQDRATALCRRRMGQLVAEQSKAALPDIEATAG